MVSMQYHLMNVPSTLDPKNLFDGKYAVSLNEGTIDQASEKSIRW